MERRRRVSAGGEDRRMEMDSEPASCFGALSFCLTVVLLGFHI